MSSSEFPRIVKNAGHIYGPMAVIFLVHLPLVVIHFTHLWENGLHAHFPLVLGAVALILWNRWEGTRSPGRVQAAISFIILGCGAVFLLFGILLWSPWLGYVALLVTIAGMLLRTCPAPIPDWGPAWLLLWLLVPLPMGLDRQLSLHLQSYSSRAASLSLDFFHVNHVRTGNVIEVPGMAFSVEEACSGIHSLFVLVAATAILVVVLRRWWLHAIGLILAAGSWAGVANMVRVAGVVIAASRFHVDLSTGWRHEVWGLALFGLAFGLVLSTDRLFCLIFFSEEDAIQAMNDDNSSGDEPLELQEASSSLVVATGSLPEASRFYACLGFLQSWGLATIFACIGSVQFMPWSTAALPTAALSNTAKSATQDHPLDVATLNEETLPFELAGWQRTGYETARRSAADVDGAFSAIWRYERGGREAVVSLDFPFSDWHQLTFCYVGRGCRILNWHLEPLIDGVGAPQDGDFAVASLQMERSRRAILLFAEWNSTGGFLDPPTTEGASISRILTDVQRRWNGRSGSFPDRCVYQLQLLSLTPRVPTNENDAAADHATSVRRLFTEAIRVLRPRTLGIPQGSS